MGVRHCAVFQKWLPALIHGRRAAPGALYTAWQAEGGGARRHLESIGIDGEPAMARCQGVTGMNTLSDPLVSGDNGCTTGLMYGATSGGRNWMRRALVLPGQANPVKHIRSIACTRKRADGA